MGKMVYDEHIYYSRQKIYDSRESRRIYLLLATNCEIAIENEEMDLKKET